MDTETGSLKIDRNHAGALLSALYERYHRPEYIHPDPLELVLEASPEDREVAGLIASSFALGRVDLIVGAAGEVIRRLQSPRAALLTLSRAELKRLFYGFRYRFFSGDQVADFLFAIGEVLRGYGSIAACFRAGLDSCDTNVLPALTRMVSELMRLAGGDIGILLSNPSKGSASKRLHLYLRWMIRRDAIDPGGWDLPRRLLIAPADVHMLRVSRTLGFTERKQPDLQAALEITACLSEICPEDPIKFDFSMTRLGIHPDLSYADLDGVNLTL